MSLRLTCLDRHDRVVPPGPHLTTSSPSPSRADPPMPTSLRDLTERSADTCQPSGLAVPVAVPWRSPVVLTITSWERGVCHPSVAAGMEDYYMGAGRSARRLARPLGRTSWASTASSAPTTSGPWSTATTRHRRRAVGRASRNAQVRGDRCDVVGAQVGVVAVGVRDPGDVGGGVDRGGRGDRHRPRPSSRTRPRWPVANRGRGTAAGRHRRVRDRHVRAPHQSGRVTPNSTPTV